MDKKICPKCENPNKCEIAEGKGVCWCFFEDIPRDLLSRDSEDSCYCKNCIQEYKE